MKKIIVLVIALLLIPAVFSEKIEIKGLVNDYAGILSPEEENALDEILGQIFNSGEAQYSLVIIDSLEGTAIESYSLELSQGELGDTEKNNGLLLLVAIEDRKYRFEVGRGIEYILNDAKVGRIGRTYLVPNFKQGEYGKGILEASLSVKSILLGDTESTYYVRESVPAGQIANTIWFIFIFFFLFVIPLFGAMFSKRRSNNWYFNAALGAAILFGGGGRGGRGGGGFGGFGGGGFAGGGAGGGW